MALRRFYLPILYTFLFGTGILIAAPILDANWIADDLHLVKHYPDQELLGALAGSWDATGSESPGYRPVTDLFYHSAYGLFGVLNSSYRVFQAGLFAAMLLVLAMAALELGFSRWQITVASLIILCTRNTWWMLVWPTDSVRPFMALFGNLALYLYLRFLKTRRLLLAASALICFSIALLTREEILPYVLLIPLIGFWMNRERKPALLFGAALLAISAGFLVLRRIFVADAVSTVFFPGWLIQIGFAVLPRLYLWIPLSLGALVLLWALVALAKPPRGVWFWLICTVIAASPGIVVSRGNNSLLPVTFFALFLVGVFSQRKALHVGVLALYLFGSVAAHLDAQRALLPNSEDRVTQAQRFLYGDWQDALPWIPPERIEVLRTEAAVTDVIETPPIWSGW